MYSEVELWIYLQMKHVNTKNERYKTGGDFIRNIPHERKVESCIDHKTHFDIMLYIIIKMIFF